MTDTLITLVRHGNTFNTDQKPIQIGLRHDLPLTNKGIEQAEQVSHTFADYPITHIYHGALSRQQLTAQIVARQHSEAQLICSDHLNEIDYGLWEGLTPEHIQKLWNKEYRLWERNCQWPEHIFSTQRHSILDNLKTWLQLVNSSKSEHVLAVTSQGILKTLLYLIPNMMDKIAINCDGAQYKVKTGHYCQITLNNKGILKIINWNMAPETITEPLLA